MRRVAVIAFPALLTLTSAVQAQSVSDLRKRADALDHLARAYIAADRCIDRPMQFDQVAFDRLGIGASDSAEFVQLTRDPRLTTEVPATPTRACIYAEESYGRQGKLVAGLLVPDPEKAAQRDLTRQGWSGGDIKGLERACVSWLYKEGFPVESISAVSRDPDEGTRFVLTFTVFYATKQSASRARCIGTMVGDTVSIAHVDITSL